MPGKISDDQFKTSILNNWIKGLDYLQAIAKKEKSIAVNEKETKQADKEYKRCEGMKAAIYALA